MVKRLQLTTTYPTRSNVPLPCVAASSTRTPTNKTHANMLADFTPAQPPMVPAVLIHCVKEIEDRGLHEVCLGSCCFMHGTHRVTNLLTDLGWLELDLESS